MSYLNGANFKVCDAVLVNGVTTVYSNSFLMRWVENFGVWVLAVSPLTNPNIRIQFEESYVPPVTEGSADTNYVVADGVADVYSAIVDEIVHIKSLNPVPMQYGRYKISGLTGNGTDTVVTIVNFQQEMI